MLIRRKIAVKVVVTEPFKTDLIERLKQTLNQVEVTEQGLQRQGRLFLSELAQKDPARSENFRQKLELRINRQLEIRDKLAKELAKAESLEIGDEYLQDTLDGFAEIHVGENLFERLGSAEILVKDGIVVQIHN